MSCFIVVVEDSANLSGLHSCATRESVRPTTLAIIVNIRTAAKSRVHPYSRKCTRPATSRALRPCLNRNPGTIEW